MMGRSSGEAKTFDTFDCISLHRELHSAARHGHDMWFEMVRFFLYTITQPKRINDQIGVHLSSTEKQVLSQLRTAYHEVQNHSDCFDLMLFWRIFFTQRYWLLLLSHLLFTYFFRSLIWNISDFGDSIPESYLTH